jgi:hypothetical protein
VRRRRHDDDHHARWRRDHDAPVPAERLQPGDGRRPHRAARGQRAFANFAYTPPCFRVSAGTRLTLSGSFAAHPLVGGEVTETETKEPDPASPFTPPTTSGSWRTFTCRRPAPSRSTATSHALIGMKGVAFVEP